jgi:hypothetical protein
VTKRWIIIVAITFVAIVVVFSACALIVSHNAAAFTRSAKAGDKAAQVLVAGSNFWARYFVFFIIGFISFGVFVRRALIAIGRW